MFMASNDIRLVENYIHFYHLDRTCLIPQYPDAISDSMSASFSNTEILSRSAPIFVYSNSGPRSVSFAFTFHREMLDDVNFGNSSFEESLSRGELVEDLINTMEAAVLPRYINATKAVNPPIVAIRIGKGIHVKGICRNVSKEWQKPIIDDKYQVVKISFTIEEMDPYDAEIVRTIGGFRGLDRNVDSRFNEIVKGQ